MSTAVKRLSMREKLHLAVTTAASSCESEAKFFFYFNEVHRQGIYDMNYKTVCLNMHLSLVPYCFFFF